MRTKQVTTCLQKINCVTVGGIISYPHPIFRKSLSEVLEKSVDQKYYLSKKAVSGMIRRSKKWGRGGYVFLQEMGRDKTLQLKLLSLQQLEKAVNLTPQQVEGEETLAPTQSEQASEELLAGYGKTLILRKLTPNEKEKLQGLPINWTLCEE